jgi:hypothetical protein
VSKPDLVQIVGDAIFEYYDGFGQHPGVTRAYGAAEHVVKALQACGLMDTREQVTIYAPNERLYGRCDACGQVKWDTDRYRGDGSGHAPERGSHCGCCTHAHDLPPGGHTLRGLVITSA